MEFVEDKNNLGREKGRQKVYDFLVDFIKTNNYSPSIREICSGTNMSSTASVHYHLSVLKLMGKIEMTSHTFRSIRLVGYSWIKTEGTS